VYETLFKFGKISHFYYMMFRGSFFYMHQQLLL